MKKLKNISLVIIASIVIALASVIFVGCDKDDDKCKMSVFATKGGCVQVNDSEDYVRFGDEGSKIFTFKENSIVKLKAIELPGYRFIKWMYADDIDEPLRDSLTNKEFEFKIDDDIIVKAVFDIDANVRYSITYPSTMVGYSIVAENGFTTSVGVDSNFKFKVNLESNYSNSNIIVKANGVVVSKDVNNVYEIEDINENIVITVEGVVENEKQPNIYSITPADNSYALVPVNQTDCEVTEGGSFTFKVAPAAGYEFGASVVVKRGGQIIQPSNPTATQEDRRYVITNINSNVSIVVEGVVEIVNAPITYQVSVPAGASYTLIPVGQSDCKVNEGENFTFKIAPKQGYMFAKTVEVKNAEQVLTAINPTATQENKQYQLLNVTSNITITVTGVDVYVPEPNVYTVSSASENYSLVSATNPTLEVEEGGSITFKIVPAQGYIFDSIVVVKQNGSVVVATNPEAAPADREYVINEVTANTTILVEGVILYVPIPQTYSVSSGADTYNVIAVSGSDLVVFAGGSVTFKIVPASGYVFGGTVVVKANGQKLDALDDSVAQAEKQYKVSNITSDVIITVEGITEYAPERESYLVNTLGTTYTIIPIGQDGFEVIEGSNFTFKVAPVEGYEFGASVVVSATGKEVIINNPNAAEKDKEYVIENITSNVTITVEGISKIATYEISAAEGIALIPVGQADCQVLSGGNFTFKVAPAVQSNVFGGTVVVKNGQQALQENNPTATQADKQYTISNVTSNATITVEVTYSFTLQLEPTVLAATGAVIPEQASLTIAYGKSSYNINGFGMQAEGYTMAELIELINEQVSLLYDEVESFNIGDVEFIKVSGTNIVVNWNAIKQESSTYALTIKVPAANN